MNKLLRITIVSLFVLVGGTTNIKAQNNLNDALKRAKSENKFVLLNFSGSDWCRSCILLKKTILESEEFKKFADNELVILDVDFPRSKKNQMSKEQVKINENLAEKYNSKGQFPTLIIMDKNGKVLGKTGYKKMNPDQYIQHIKSYLQ